jgi:hypothetical protein
MKQTKSEKLKQWYQEELKRRDKQIEELREHNLVLMKASMKSADRIAELTEKLKKTIKK